MTVRHRCTVDHAVVDHDVDYGLFDADQHYYEPQDCLTRHLDTQVPERRQVGADVEGG